MATNKFATMLHKNTHNIILVLVYAILEWILIFLLLINSLISLFISKFAFYFGLKPPCIFCSRLDHILDLNNNNYKDIICDEHKVSQFAYRPNHQKSNLEWNMKEENESEILGIIDTSYVGDEVQEKNTNEVFEKMEIGELVNSIIMAMQDLVIVATEEARSPCTDSNVTKEPSELQEGEDNDCLSLNSENEFEFFKGGVSSSPHGQVGQPLQENDKIGISNSPDKFIANNLDRDINEVEGQTISEKLLPKCCDGNIISGIEFCNDTMTIGNLKAELKAKREALSALYMELQEERNASAIAANQTLNIITRLQQEKSAMQIEAQEYHKMMEEQSEYDQEALQLLNDLMGKKEKEKQELEKELEIYRRRVLDYEVQENFFDNDDICTDTEFDFEETGIDCVRKLSFIDESLEEFEVERILILEELNALEMKLVSLANEDEDSFGNINQIGYHNFEFVSPNEIAMVVHDESKKVFPYSDENNIMSEEKIESSSTNKIKFLDFKFKEVNRIVAIEEEVGHIYERLQGLETDRDFLKHCLVSLSKGEEGLGLLRDILQHIRDLRTVEVRARSVCDSPLS